MDDLAPRLNFDNSKFALVTIKERWPVILAGVIDSLYHRRRQYVETLDISADQIKALIAELAHLRYEVTTDKCLLVLKANLGCCNDLELWNEQLRKFGVSPSDSLKFKDGPTWFSLPWLLTECYLYRRIAEAVSLNGLGPFDPFAIRKQSGVLESQDRIYQILRFFGKIPKSLLEEGIERIFSAFLQVALWANEFDLSLHPDQVSVNEMPTTVMEHLRRAHSRMVVNELDTFLRFWTKRLDEFRSTPISRLHTTAIVLDNAGVELITDLCLAEFLIDSGLTDRVFLYPKSMPWFVSDVTPEDIDWLVHTGLNSKFLKPPLSKICDQWSKKWRERIEDNTFNIRPCNFWTLPCSYDEMREVSPRLYSELSQEVDTIIFKGDLNYRKIVADRAWLPDKPEDKVKALRPLQFGRPLDMISCKCTVNSVRQPLELGDAHDCRSFTDAESVTSLGPLILALRVCKAGVAVGLNPKKLTNLIAASEDWWTIGHYALAQVISPLKVE
ncbi:unnamed protein product [Calicophoron daubneyi]|uniref:Sugar phosphate phosphatase n=1 Tax=Calicophoron daubneyi TaxID=300641 RepID=A0AAV2T253_CALDB